MHTHTDPTLHWKMYKVLQIKRVRDLLLYKNGSLKNFVAVSFVTWLAEPSLHHHAGFSMSCKSQDLWTVPSAQPRCPVSKSRCTVSWRNVLVTPGAKCCLVAPEQQAGEQSQVVALRDICTTTGTELVLKLSRKSNPLSCNFPKWWQLETNQ